MANSADEKALSIQRSALGSEHQVISIQSLSIQYSAFSIQQFQTKLNNDLF